MTAIWQNALTDVSGIRVGNVSRVGDGALTGVTVVLAPPGTCGGVDVRGGGPGTHETDMLSPTTLTATVDAVVLTGGSALGLVSAAGVAQWCAEHGRGFRVDDDPAHVVPLVPAAAIYDLGRGGDFFAYPSAAMGYAAAEQAVAQPDGAAVPRGTVGAGTGAAINYHRNKGGLGTASVRLEGGGVVAALAIVNALGTPLTPGAESRVRRTLPPELRSFNTTIAVVATDAALTKAETSRLATVAHDGFARAIDPVHTLSDGDTVFSLATGRRALSAAGTPERVSELFEIHASAAEAMRLAIIDGVTSARTIETPGLTLTPFE